MKLSLMNHDDQLTRVKCEEDISMTLLPEGDPLVAAVGDGVDNVYTRVVLLNCQGTKFIDSSGLSWLLICQKRFKESGGRLILHSVPPLVRQPIDLLRLDKVFAIAATDADAVALARGEKR